MRRRSQVGSRRRLDRNDQDWNVWKQIVLMTTQESKRLWAPGDHHIGRQACIFCPKEVADQLVIRLISFISKVGIVEKFSLIFQIRACACSKGVAKIFID